MTKARPFHERELLIDDDMRINLHKTIDPRIDDALDSRGFTEERHATDRINLDSSKVIPSYVFRKLYEAPFDGLSLDTTYDVYKDERKLSESTLRLSRIGGFSASRIITVGDKYLSRNFTAGENTAKSPPTRLKEDQFEEVLQDLRAHTELGYSNSDTNVPAFEVIAEIERLHSSVTVDQRAHYQMLTSKEHGDIQMNIGRSFEIRDVKSSGRIMKRSTSMKRLFEIIAKQPIEGGTATVGIHYRSGRNMSNLKITTEIDSDYYSEDEKQSLYDGMVRDYQEKDIHKFGRGALRNLEMITDSESDIIRLG